MSHTSEKKHTLMHFMFLRNSHIIIYMTCLFNSKGVVNGISYRTGILGIGHLLEVKSVPMQKAVNEKSARLLVSCAEPD